MVTPTGIYESETVYIPCKANDVANAVRSVALINLKMNLLKIQFLFETVYMGINELYKIWM